MELPLFLQQCGDRSPLSSNAATVAINESSGTAIPSRAPFGNRLMLRLTLPESAVKPQHSKNPRRVGCLKQDAPDARRCGGHNSLDRLAKAQLLSADATHLIDGGDAAAGTLVENRLNPDRVRADDGLFARRTRQPHQAGAKGRWKGGTGGGECIC